MYYEFYRCRVQWAQRRKDQFSIRAQTNLCTNLTRLMRILARKMGGMLQDKRTILRGNQNLVLIRTLGGLQAGLRHGLHQHRPRKNNSSQNRRLRHDHKTCKHILQTHGEHQGLLLLLQSSCLVPFLHCQCANISTFLTSLLIACLSMQLCLLTNATICQGGPCLLCFAGV